MKYETLSKHDACAILDALDGKAPLDSDIRAKLENLRLYHLRDEDVAANYQHYKPNRELCERWNCSQGTLNGIARKLGLI